MTQTKIERIRQELIAQYGDVTLVQYYNRKTQHFVGSVRLSTVAITCTADMKEVQRVLRSGKTKQIYM